MRAGEIITADDKYWSDNIGPWVDYANAPEEDVRDTIGDPLGDDWYPHIRRIAKKKKAKQ